MEGTIGEVRLFAGNFAPRSWAFCEGQLLAISQNTALFSILGTTYGGDGRTTFGLPDLRGRSAIGKGHGPGLSTRTEGHRGGTETHTLNILEMPSHNHSATFQQEGASNTTITGNVSVTPIAVADDGTTDDPTNAYPAVHEGPAESDAKPFSTSPDDHVNMASLSGNFEGNVAVSGINGVVRVGQSGNNQSFNIMQPWLAIPYIICLAGVFPSRS